MSMNWPRAGRFLEKASKMGAKRANFDLAHMYENGIGGAERNPKYAVKLLPDSYHDGRAVNVLSCGVLLSLCRC